MKRVTFLMLVISCFACEDESASERPPAEPDARIITVVDAEPDLPLIPVDAGPQGGMEVEVPPPDPCENVTVQDSEQYCLCHQHCCQTQTWYCPPRPDQQIHRKTVVVEICDESLQACEYGIDADCPPPEIIWESHCQLAFECPPGSTRDFLEWFDCELGDGSFGRQMVVCDKGRLQHGPCLPCEDEACDGEDNDCDDRIDEGFYACETECGPGLAICTDGQVGDCIGNDPQEEVCDFEDNDCDGETDEGQRNECDSCGAVPADICDGLDNDCDGQIDEELIRECETICGTGMETCSSGNWISCTATQPTEEEDPCDGEDNDCDGNIDEGLNCDCTLEDIGVLVPCFEQPLICGQGFKTCECRNPPECTVLGMSDCLALCAHIPAVAGVEECDRLTGMAIETEICNNFDEDCDQSIDEQLVTACYTGPENTLGVGVCESGNMICSEGRWGNIRNNRFVRDFCDDEITPSQEVCDGADNDCDGIVDYGEEISDTDILFILDWSGSMGEETAAVKSALNRFAAHFQAEEQLQWGLIVGPKRHPLGREHLYLVSDIAPFEDFLSDFAALGDQGMDTSEEMLRDALYFSLRNITANAGYDVPASNWRRFSDAGSTPDKEDFLLNWRPNVDKIIIVFSDEEDQSHLQPELMPEIITAAIAGTPRMKLYTFTTVFNRGNWENWAGQSGGRNFDLTWNQNEMYQNLMSIIDEACLGPREQNGDPPPEEPQQEEGEQANNMRPASYFYVRYDYVSLVCL